jgi:Zinc finger, C3HC4 type (RING finger)
VVKGSTDDFKIDETLHLITPIQLSQYYMLACRLTELLAVRQVYYENRLTQAADSTTTRNECLICLECNLTGAILPCGHVMCELCETRCLRQKLACPFCRATFASAQQVRKDGWSVMQTDWSAAAGTPEGVVLVDSLHHDIAALTCQMNEYCWMKDIIFTTETQPAPNTTTLSLDETMSVRTICTTSSRTAAAAAAAAADATAFLDTAENNILDGYVQLPRQFHTCIEPDDGFALVQ